MTDLTPLERLHEAILAFVLETNDFPEGTTTVIPTAVIAWEEMCFGEDGQANRFQYATTGDSFVMSSGIGLIEMTRENMKRDVFNCTCPED